MDLSPLVSNFLSLYSSVLHSILKRDSDDLMCGGDVDGLPLFGEIYKFDLQCALGRIQAPLL